MHILIGMLLRYALMFITDLLDDDFFATGVYDYA